MKKLFLNLTIFIFIFSLILPNGVLAQVTASDQKIEEMKQDIDLWLGQQGADAYLLWQYSGPADTYWENDDYSFFGSTGSNSPVCAALKEKSDQYADKMVGVNIHSFANHASEIGTTLDYLKDECGVKIIRIWGTPDRGDPAPVLSAAAAKGIKVIVVIADYSNSSDPILPGAIRSNPTNWYDTGYKSLYLPYARNLATKIGSSPALYALELANEPHCSGLAECVPVYVKWANDAAQAIKSANSAVKISIGQMASSNTARGDSPGPGDYGSSNSSGFVNYTSAHHYGAAQNQVNIEARGKTNKPFYIGEAGFAFGEIPSGSGAPQEDQRPLDVQQPLTIACNQTGTEFHALRPYPANACDPLIPQSIPKALDRQAPDYQKYITYSCGPQLQPVGTEAFDPYGDNAKYDGLKVTNAAGQQYDHTICDKDPNGLGVTCWRSSSFNVTVDLKDANLGILGNTQTGSLTDEQKVNEYLSYYLTGVPEVADPLIDASQEQIDRVVNFSGPLRKLLPWDLQNSEARATIANANTIGEDVHDYDIEGEGYFGSQNQNLSNFTVPPDMNDPKYKNNQQQYQKDLTQWRYGKDSGIPNIFGLDPIQTFREIFNLQTISSKLFQNIPLTSVEDIAGEFILTIFGDDKDGNPNIGKHSDRGKETAPSEITIMSATKASGGSGGTTTLPTTYQNKVSEDDSISCTKNLKIMPFGDSITVGIDRSGTGIYSPGGYRGPLKTNLTSAGYTIDMVGTSLQEKATLEMTSDSEHEGHGAQRASVLAGIISDAVKTTNPDVVLVHVGTNNLTDGGIQEDIDSVEKIITEIHNNNPNSLIILAKILPIPAYSLTNSRDVPAYNTALEQFDSLPNVVLVNMNSISESLLPDKIHPNKAGYEAMAGIWATAIKANCK